MKRLGIKRVVASFFLWLAGLLLIAHTAITHHHHEVDYDCHFHAIHICENSTHEVDDKQNNNCCSSKSCTLTHVVIRSNEGHKDEHLTNTSHTPPTHYTLFYSEINSENNINKDLLFSQILYIPIYYTNYISSSQGLRAPPFC